MKPGRRSRFVPLSLAVLLAAACIMTSATQTQTLLSSSQDLWSGYPDGVRVSIEGALLPSSAFEKGADLSALPLCAVAADGAVYAGTAPSGDLLTFRDGAVTVAHHFQEPLITALTVLKNGDLLVGTSTPAKVYRYVPSTGQATVLASLKADYVWALLPEARGVLAAAGNPGAVYRIGPGGEVHEVLHTDAHHVRCLVNWRGRVWAGTSSPAAIYAIGEKGNVCAATLNGEEIPAMGTDGKDLLLAVNTKASAAPASKDGKGSGNGGGSTLYIMKPGMTPTYLKSFDAAVSSILSTPDGCSVGLVDGRLVEVRGSGLFLAAHWDGSPVATIASASGGQAVFTGAPAAIYLSGNATSHAYVSPVLDLKAPSTLGRTEVTGGDHARIFLRSGNTTKPGEFWSPWKPAEDARDLPPAQYAQWKLEMGGGKPARLVSVTYLPENRPPVFASAEIDSPGKIYARSVSQLGDHLVREIHQKDSPFPTLAESPSPSAPPQTYYLAGYRMVTWKVTDPDGDDVRVTVQFKPEKAGAWYDLAKDVSDSYFVFDAQGLPDGIYRMRLIASDAPSNPEGRAGSATIELPVFVIDNTPPSLDVSLAAPGKLKVVATDNTAVQSVRASVDGGPWQVLTAVRGTEGAGRRTYLFEYTVKGAHWVLFQAVDPYRNETTRGWLTADSK